MTNQSREAFVFAKWCEEEFGGEPAGLWSPFHAGWQAALSEGRRQGIEEAADLVLKWDDGKINGRWQIRGAIHALIVGGGEK